MRTSRQEWAKRVERWQDSDLTAGEFGAELGINPRTLRYWKWRLAKDAKSVRSAKTSAKRTAAKKRTATRKSRKAKPKFVELPAPVTASERVELVVGEQMLVRVPDGFDEETLRRVLRTLRAKEDRS